MRQCACGVDLSERHPNARFCSDRCRKAAQRGAVAEVVPIERQPQAECSGDSPGSVVEATRKALTEVGQAEAAKGVAALALAVRLDSQRDTGAGLASLNREWRATLDAALMVARPVSSVGRMRDELAARRGA